MDEAGGEHRMAKRARDGAAEALRRRGGIGEDDGDIDNDDVCDGGSSINDGSACAHCLEHLAAIHPDAPPQANREHRQAIMSHFRVAPALHGFALESTAAASYFYVYAVPCLLTYLFLRYAMHTGDDDDDAARDGDANEGGGGGASADSVNGFASTCIVSDGTDPEHHHCGKADRDVLLGVYFEMVDYQRNECGRAMRHYRRAARRGFVIAQFNVARLLLSCDNSDEQTAAFCTFDTLARRGHVESHYYVCLCYKLGYGVDLDARRRAKVLHRSVAFDDKGARAQYEYAVCLQYGIGVARDCTAANKLFARVCRTYERWATREDDRWAMLFLGEMYEHGLHFKQSNADAVRHYEAAAARGNVRARRKLAFARLWGELGLVADAASAMVELKQLATSGDVGSMSCLADVFHRGCSGVPQNHARSVKWHHRVVRGCDGDDNGANDCSNECTVTWRYWVTWSLYALAWYCQYGDRFAGMRTDKTRAGQLYLLAAQRGHLDSQEVVIKAYLFGRLGFNVDNAQAVRWLSEAAYSGSKLSQATLFDAYDRELLGLHRDGDAMYDLTVHGAALGDAVAVYNMATCYARGLGVPADAAQARAHLHRSAEMGLREAHWHLAGANRHGDERYAIKRDAAVAHRHTCAAARLGCKEARQHLWEQCARWTAASSAASPGSGNENGDVLRIELPWVRDAFCRPVASPSPLTLRVLLSRAAVVVRVMRHHATSPLHRWRGAMCDTMFAETLLAFVCREYVAEAGVAVEVPAGALLAVVRSVGASPATWCTSSAELLLNAFALSTHSQVTTTTTTGRE